MASALAAPFQPRVGLQGRGWAAEGLPGSGSPPALKCLRYASACSSGWTGRPECPGYRSAGALWAPVITRGRWRVMGRARGGPAGSSGGGGGPVTGAAGGAGRPQHAPQARPAAAAQAPERRWARAVRRGAALVLICALWMIRSPPACCPPILGGAAKSPGSANWHPVHALTLSDQPQCQSSPWSHQSALRTWAPCASLLGVVNTVRPIVFRYVMPYT